MSTAHPPTFEVVRLKSRKPAPAKIKSDKPQALPLSELIERVRRIKDMARELRGVGRNGPEAFTEDKSDLRRAAELLEDDLRRRGVNLQA